MVMEYVITTAIDSESQLESLAKILARNLLLPRVYGLIGELGAGKTTFVQALARQFNLNSGIVSPTFTLAHHHELSSGGQFIHADFYRLNDANEAELLDLFQTDQNNNNIVVVEWADKFVELMPSTTVWIEFIVTGHRKTALIRRLSAADGLTLLKALE